MKSLHLNALTTRLKDGSCVRSKLIFDRSPKVDNSRAPRPLGSPHQETSVCLANAATLALHGQNLAVPKYRDVLHLYPSSILVYPGRKPRFWRMRDLGVYRPVEGKIWGSGDTWKHARESGKQAFSARCWCEVFVSWLGLGTR